MRRAAAVEWWALGLWTGSRLLVIFAATVALGGLAALLGGLDAWQRWDATHLVEIAQYGYDGNPDQRFDPGLRGFLPGLPLLLHAVHYVIPNWTLAGLVISLVASLVATLSLVRLGDAEGPHGTGPRAATFLLFSPWAVFLAAGYTEATFLAFALPAWLHARRGRWGWAGLLAMCASTIRITGLFLAIALIVMFVTQVVRERRRQRSRRRRGRHATRHASPKDYALIPDRAGDRPAVAEVRRSPARALALVLPFLPLAAFTVYLWAKTGDWTAWLTAQEQGWGRTFTWPWESLATTWENAMLPGENQLPFIFELIAAPVGVGLCLYLLLTRRLDELVYVGLQVGALLTSSYYLSVTRATLLWWPLWLLLGRLAMRRWWLLMAYLVVSVPAMGYMTARFVVGDWAG
ncbi:MAG: hypothetical protein GEV10_17945 [Streptosporangiales bacterium]|nr:hypothetical protein [Streptosporangiales bacterium]